MNNVEATLVLLKNGANRDMQDNKVCISHPRLVLHEFSYLKSSFYVKLYPIFYHFSIIFY